MSYEKKSINLKNNKLSLTCIDDSVDVDLLTKDTQQYCVYTYKNTPNLKYLDSIKDKVFLVALVDTSVEKNIIPIITKFLASDYDIDKPFTELSYNNIIKKYEKPTYLSKQNKVTKAKLKRWYNQNQHLLNSSTFKVQNFGSFLGGDLDLLITKKKKTTIKEVSSFLKQLIDSGNKLKITIEPFFCNDADYFEEFYYRNNKAENRPVLMGWYADKDYPSQGKKVYKDNLCLMYYPWKELFYQSCHKDEVKKLITSFSELDDDLENVHISPSIYYTVFNRYANLKTLSRWS